MPTKKKTKKLEVMKARKKAVKIGASAAAGIAAALVGGYLLYQQTGATAPKSENLDW